MKIREIIEHDDEPLVLHILRKLIRSDSDIVIADFDDGEDFDGSPKRTSGAIYRIDKVRPEVYDFSLTNSAAMPNVISFSAGVIDDMELKKGKVDGAGRQHWILSDTEGP